jgi:hypothetical protein
VTAAALRVGELHKSFDKLDVLLAAAAPGGLSVTRSVLTSATGEYLFDGVPANAAVTVSLFDGSGTVVAQAAGTTGDVGTMLDRPLVSPSLGTARVCALMSAQAFPGLATVTSDNPTPPRRCAYSRHDGRGWMPRARQDAAEPSWPRP